MGTVAQGHGSRPCGPESPTRAVAPSGPRGKRPGPYVSV